MKRLWRWLFNFAAAVSLVLCIALVVLWIRSFWKVGSLAIDHRGGTCFWVEIERGQLALWKQRRAAPATQPARHLVIQSGEKLASVRPKNAITSSVLGFGAESVPRAPFVADFAMAAKLRLAAEEARNRADAADQSVRQAQARGELGNLIGLRQARAAVIRLDAQQLQKKADQLGTHTEWQVSAPMWAPFFCLIWIPYLFMAKTWKLYKRKKLGWCLACGYDLRATPDRCPECGAIPAGAIPPAAKGAAT